MVFRAPLCVSDLHWSMGTRLIIGLVLAGLFLVSCKPADHANLPPDLQTLLQHARQGDANAQYVVALRYRMGQGVAQDDRQALQWMTKAAEQSHPAAQFELGSYYTLPEYSDQDYGKAAYWLRQSAEQGYARAQFSLGALYYTGRGVGQDRLEAYAWMSMAVANGYPEAFDKLMGIKAGFTPEEFEQAHKRALYYQEKYSPPH